METLSILLRDLTLKNEVTQAFVDHIFGGVLPSGAADNEEATLMHLEQYVMAVLNQCREKMLQWPFQKKQLFNNML